MKVDRYLSYVLPDTRRCLRLFYKPERAHGDHSRSLLGDRGDHSLSLAGDLGDHSVSLLGNRKYCTLSLAPDTLPLFSTSSKSFISVLGLTRRACFRLLISNTPRVSSRFVTGTASSVLFQVPRPRFSCAMRWSCSVDPACHSAWP